MKILTIFSAILFICFYASTSSADIYSWTDKSGVTHFTNYSPPPAAKLVIKDMPVSRSTVPEKETIAKDLFGEAGEIKPDLEEDAIQVKRKKVEVSEEVPYSSDSYDSNVSSTDGAKNGYVSKYPPGFHRTPPELHRFKHHPNYHYKYHSDKPYAKKRHSDFRHKRRDNRPTIWDRNPRLRQKGHTGLDRKRVFGWQTPKTRGRPSAHSYAFGGGHYRGTSIKGRGHFRGRSSAFGAKGRFGGRGSAFGTKGPGGR